MSIFKNTTSMNKVAGDSMWYPMEHGNTSKWWPKYESKGDMSMSKGRMPANPSDKSMKEYKLK